MEDLPIIHFEEFRCYKGNLEVLDSDGSVLYKGRVKNLDYGIVAIDITHGKYYTLKRGDVVRFDDGHIARVSLAGR